MKRKRADFVSPSAALDVKSSKRRLTARERLEQDFKRQIQSADYIHGLYDERRRERERGLRAKNTERQRKARRDYQTYRDIAERLSTENPQLRRVPQTRLAKTVQAELRKTQPPPSVRTIRRALGPKNKI
jgi:hypothetical protein